MTELNNPYLSISDGELLSYGGSQLKSDSEIIKKCGCGIVAAADLMLYLRLYRFPVPGAVNPLPLARYNEYLKFLNKRYFPLIPGLGMNSLALTAGLNLLFRAKKLPLRASWLFSGEKLFSRIRQQLSEDFPVIISVGPDFPRIWEKSRLNLYTSGPEGLRRSSSVRAHFMTVTGIDEQYLKISSWGREYYINQQEFSDYAKSKSSSLLCNMLKISLK